MEGRGRFEPCSKRTPSSSARREISSSCTGSTSEVRSANATMTFEGAHARSCARYGAQREKRRETLACLCDCGNHEAIRRRSGGDQEAIRRHDTLARVVDALAPTCLT